MNSSLCKSGAEAFKTNTTPAQMHEEKLWQVSRTKGDFVATWLSNKTMWQMFTVRSVTLQNVGNPNRCQGGFSNILRGRKCTVRLYMQFGINLLTQQLVWHKSNSFINPSQCFRCVLMPVVSRIHVLSAQSCWGGGSGDCKVVHSKCGQVKAAVIAHLHGIATGMCRRLSAWGQALRSTDGLPGPRLL